MHNSKLTEILKKLNPAEVKRFREFINSPYHNKSERLAQFAEIVLDAYPNFNEEQLNKQKIYSQIYKDKKYTEFTVNTLMKNTVNALENFFSIEMYLRKEADQKLNTLKSLRLKGLETEFIKVANQFRENYNNIKKDEDYQYFLVKFEDELWQFYMDAKEQISDGIYLQNKSDSLDLYFLASKLKMACNIINYQNVFSSRVNFSFLDEIMTYVSANLDKFENVFAVKIYYRIILTLTKPNEETHFYELENDLFKVIDYFSTTELKDLFGFAQNYCIKKINSGKEEFSHELLRLYKKILETGIIFDNGKISQWDYKNIVSIGLRLNEYEWVENFLNENKIRILPMFRDVAFNFNMANLFYVKKDFKKTAGLLLNFQEALSRIDDSNFDSSFYNLDYRILLMKVYYESYDGPPFHAMLRSFRLFLERNKKISQSNRVIYLNLLKNIKKLSDIRDKIGFKNPKELKSSFDKLKNSIEEEQNIVSLPWLLTQVQELEKELTIVSSPKSYVPNNHQGEL